MHFNIKFNKATLPDDWMLQIKILKVKKITNLKIKIEKAFKLKIT